MDPKFYGEYYEQEDRHWWFLGRRDILLTLLDRELPTVPGGARREILDVGCGTGMMLTHLTRYGDVSGAEASDEAIAFCRQRGLDRVIKADGAELPFADASFDLVTALDVIEHIEDDACALDEMWRVLRPGGRLLVTVPAYGFLWSEHDVVNHHFRRYVRDELAERVRSTGFEPLRLSYFNTLLFPPVALVRLLRLNAIGGGNRSDRSDLGMGGGTGLVNRVLRRVFASEAPLVARRDLPFGISLLCLAAKPAAGR